MNLTKLSKYASALAAVLAGTIAYFDDLDNKTDPPWLVQHAITYKSKIALALFVLTVILTVCDFLRDYIESRNSEEKVVAKILDDLSKTLFPQGGRQNRITLFKRTEGWRTFCWGLIRLPIFKRTHKWRALWRTKWRDSYLSVYMRPMDTKGRRSTAAFRVSDESQECEGIAGQIWDDAGQKIVIDLPRMDQNAIRRIRSQSELDADPTIKAYASSINMLNYKSLDACDHFARHFFGTLIRKSDGEPWGVLLLDSFEDKCPFTIDGKPAETFVQRFNDYAKLIGKIVG
jgi:hypothetical protein